MFSLSGRLDFTLGKYNIADIALMVEQHTCNVMVVGSSPTIGFESRSSMGMFIQVTILAKL